MKNYRMFLALVLPAALTLPAQAGLIFGKHARGNPAQRVPELIAVVKTDKNESKRESAARELREYDPVAYPDIIPVLADVLQQDPTVGVRTEAAQSLGKLRPVSQVAGWALEEALKDSSIRVRLQARSALLGYRLSGYRSDGQVAQAPAVPSAPARPSIVSPSLLNPTSAQPLQPRIVTSSGETPAPPLAGAAPAPVFMGSPRPLVPTASPALQTSPSQSGDAGPDLSPGKN